MPVELTFEHFAPYLVRAIRIVLILAAAYVISRVLRTITTRLTERITAVMETHGDMGREAIKKRTATMSGILRTVAAVAIWSVAVVMCLKEGGFDIGPVLAGAGIAGLAIGFGAQSLVKDVITGAFMLLEDSVRIGDVVQLNGTGGLVEEISLRTTVLRSFDGTVHVFPNGSIQTLANMTKEFSYYVFDMGVAYKEDTDRVAEVMRDVAKELWQDPEFGPEILEPLEIVGVDRFADSAVVIKARIKTKPIKQWMVGRELNRRFKKKFDELGIQIPFPQRTVHHVNPAGRVQLELDDPIREEIKKLVNDVIDDREKRRNSEA